MMSSVESANAVVTYNPPVVIARSSNGASTSYVKFRRDRTSVNSRPAITAVAMRSAVASELDAGGPM